MRLVQAGSHTWIQSAPRGSRVWYGTHSPHHHCHIRSRCPRRDIKDQHFIWRFLIVVCRDTLEMESLIFWTKPKSNSPTVFSYSAQMFKRHNKVWSSVKIPIDYWNFRSLIQYFFCHCTIWWSQCEMHYLVVSLSLSLPWLFCWSCLLGCIFFVDKVFWKPFICPPHWTEASGQGELHTYRAFWIQFQIFNVLP